jgi:hypothetical protein
MPSAGEDKNRQELVAAYEDLLQSIGAASGNLGSVSQTAKRFHDTTQGVLAELLANTINRSLLAGQQADPMNLRNVAIDVATLLGSVHLAIRHPANGLPATLGSWIQNRGHPEGGYRLFTGNKGENWHPDPAAPVSLIPAPRRRVGAFEALVRRRLPGTRETEFPTRS